LLLHYLSNASGAPLSGEWITFRELPSGAVYTNAFQKRAIIPFVKAFGTQPTALTAVAGRQYSFRPACPHLHAYGRFCRIGRANGLRHAQISIRESGYEKKTA